jgi:hypothetical protein
MIRPVMATSRIAVGKRVLDVLLTLVAVFRVVIGYTVDVAFVLGYPLQLAGCAQSCASAMCRWNCDMRAALHLDLSAYVASGIDPVSSARGPGIRLLAGLYFLVAHLFVVLAYALWTRKGWIRRPAIAMGIALLGVMTAFLAAGLLGQPPSTSPLALVLSNIVDLTAPLLVLARVVPKPLFGEASEPTVSRAG